MNCRHCGSHLSFPFVNLGTAPPSNAYLEERDLSAPERYFPLRVLVCTDCWLVQTEDYARANELFSPSYAYFSSFSTTWLDHAERYVCDMVSAFQLTNQSCVVEVAANDGYLLQYVKARNIPCFGIEPTASTAAAARAKGIDIVERFFDVALATELIDQGKRADLLVANNVLAHVPDINGFCRAVSMLLHSSGVATFEFPHLMRLVAETQFDTIYHEHYSYLSLTAVDRIFGHNGLHIFNVEELPTHGGSLRVFAQRSASSARERNTSVTDLLEREAEKGVETREFYEDFQRKAEDIRDDFVSFLIEAKRAGKTVAGYGAAAKGNTLLNYAGTRPDQLTYVADRNTVKQGKFLPGCRIPVVSESRIHAEKPDYIVILPWNLRDEIVEQLSYVSSWGGQFVTAVPCLKLHRSETP
ncbi:MAG: class I SAM-dependent methyltransferase [Acidobacteriaceae bacterium]